MMSGINITECGAVGDGRSLNTGAIAKAIEKCQNLGGGTVIVPAGVFLTGPLNLKSNITLFLDSGAKLVFSDEKDKYDIINTFWEGKNCKAYSPQIFAENEENVSIIGKGIIDGQGRTWWEEHRNKSLNFPRPRMIGFQNCKNVSVEGVTLIDSPSWTINPIFCENIIIDKVKIYNPGDSPNTDGIDPDSCKNVHVSNCHIDVGDDCIAVKAGTESRFPSRPCENITITNCTMVHGHGGVVIGSEMSGNVRNVTVSNCVFQGTDRGIRLKTRRGRGGIIEDIWANNIIIEDTVCPFVINMFYSCGISHENVELIASENVCPVNEGTPVIKGVHFSNIAAKGVNSAAGFIYGLPEMPIKNITFHNIDIKVAEDAKLERPAMGFNVEPMRKRGFILKNVNSIMFEHVYISGTEGNDFDFSNVNKVKLLDCEQKTILA